MKNEEDVLVDVPRRACNVEAIVPHVRHAVDSTKKSLYRGCQFVTTTPTSRYIVAVLTEATHFAMERVSKTISSLQTAEESEWTYADDVVSGERWLT